jgi:hypothetical protein
MVWQQEICNTLLDLIFMTTITAHERTLVNLGLQEKFVEFL